MTLPAPLGPTRYVGARERGRELSDGPTASAQHRHDETWRVGAYAICRRGDEVLLVRASSRTLVQGRWFLPGGGLRFGEHPDDAVLRELREETGLTGTISRLVSASCDVHDRVAGGRLAMVRLVYAVEVDDGALVHEVGGTSDEARWVPMDEVVAIGATDYVVLALGLDPAGSDEAT